MSVHVTSIFQSLVRNSFFKFLTRFFYPELMMAGIYLLLWIDPFLFGEKGFEGLSMAIWMEFILAHAGTGIGVTGMFFGKNSFSRKLTLTIVSSFYFLFVGAICWITSNIFGAITFITLSYKRVMGYHDSLGIEMFFSFMKAMILVLAGGLAFLAASILPAAIENLEGEKGAEMVPAWGFIYFIILHLFEQNKNKLFGVKMKKASR